MAGYLEDCPLPASLPYIPQKDCNFTLDQITRILVVRLSATLVGAEAPAPFTDEDALLEKANWEALLSGAEDNKGVLTPPIANLIIPRSEATFYGGEDNTTVNGLPIYTGQGNVSVTGELHNTPPAILEATEKIAQESNGGFGYPRVGAFFFGANGQIAYKATDTDPVKLIPFLNFNVSSPGSEGYKAPTIANIGFTLYPDWYKGLKLVVPNFDTKELVNVE